MKKECPSSNLQMIPIDKIEVLNSRDRNGKVFADIVGNIKNIGLKKPITVTPRTDADGNEKFMLICGEGRLNAFKSLGETTIPAMVVDVSDEDAFIMSLAENIARRQGRTLELLAGIEKLRDQGYDKKAIALKTGLGEDYVYGILQLLKNGEERLLIAVEQGRIPLNAALTIAGAGSNDKDIRQTISQQFGYDLARTVDQIRPDYRYNERSQDTVPQALICAIEATDFEDAIRNAISIGGDSDTIAAIAGSVAEALFGIGDEIATQAWTYLPQEMRAVLHALYESVDCTKDCRQ